MRLKTKRERLMKPKAGSFNWFLKIDKSVAQKKKKKKEKTNNQYQE